MYLRFQNPSPCECFSIPLSLWGVFQNPSPCEGFFKTPLLVRGFSKPLCLWGIFQNPSPCEGFFKTPLPVRGFSKPLSLWGVFQNPSPCEGFFKNPLSVKSFSKVLSLWRVFQSPSPYDGLFCLGRKHSSLLGFQKYPPSQFKNKWTGMLQESLFQCVFEPKLFCENFETYIHTRLGAQKYIHVCTLSRLPEVIPLTIQKKLNRNAPGEPFPVCFWTLNILWKFRDIHTHLRALNIHTYIHTYIRTYILTSRSSH